jgi:hypothetical protein
MSLALSIGNILHVVPISYTYRWNYINNIREELNCDIIPVPLAEEEFDLWLQLEVCIRDNACNPIILPTQALLTVVRMMDPTDELWRLYYLIPQDNKEVISPWEAVGNVVIKYRDTTYRDGLTYELVGRISPDTEEENVRDKIELRGILYIDWLRADQPFILSWREISWRLIIEKKLSYVLIAKSKMEKKCCELTCYFFANQYVEDDYTSYSYDIFSNIDISTEDREILYYWLLEYLLGETRYKVWKSLIDTITTCFYRTKYIIDKSYLEQLLAKVTQGSMSCLDASGLILQKSLQYRTSKIK